ncbi:MAG: hypothetical protein DMF63_13650 [Acidobacteria bacterium]|nr:MAG: hypothetical protein DMF63_13650 [Acidobacteriota bacterium]
MKKGVPKARPFDFWYSPRDLNLRLLPCGNILCKTIPGKRLPTRTLHWVVNQNFLARYHGFPATCLKIFSFALQAATKKAKKLLLRHNRKAP